MERGTFRGIALFRWGAWAWMTIVAVLNRADLARPWLIWLLVGSALVVTSAITLVTTTRPRQLASAPIVCVELALAAVLQFAGGWAYVGDPFAGSHSVGFAWPLAGVLTAGAAWGAVRGGLIGGTIGAMRVVQPLAAGLALADIERSQWFSIASTVILYVLAGAIAGHVSDLLRRLELDISAARARDEVARTLHDGVLQTLAIIERRSDDPLIAKLARDQDRDLRAYLGGEIAAPAQSLAARLRSTATRHEQIYDGRVTLALAPDLKDPTPAIADALCGAVTEALANAGKHGAASATTIFVEPEDGGGVMCSIRDNGVGFDRSSVTEGMGIARSIRARIDEVGGRVEIESATGSGTEVRLWLPS